MGYYTEIVGEIDYSGLLKVNQEVIEKVFDTIDFIQWGCSSSYNCYDQREHINYYTHETEWIHHFRATIDKTSKIINLSGERKNYYNATETFLYLISPYLNKNKTYRITTQGEDEEDENIVEVKNGKVYTYGEEFKTNNRLAFPFPMITFK